MIFDITDSENYGVNLPTKYFTGIFPEIQKTLDSLNDKLQPQTWKPVAGGDKGTLKEVVSVEEYEEINDILDKLSRNNYDRTCLTEKELGILNKS